MLVIKKNQIDVFEKVMFSQFEDKMVAYLKDCHSNALADENDQKIRLLIRDGAKKAKKYGVETEWDVCRFIQLIVIYGPEYEEKNEDIRNILEDEMLSGTSKINTLFKKLDINPVRKIA